MSAEKVLEVLKTAGSPESRGDSGSGGSRQKGRRQGHENPESRGQNFIAKNVLLGTF